LASSVCDCLPIVCTLVCVCVCVCVRVCVSLCINQSICLLACLMMTYTFFSICITRLWIYVYVFLSPSLSLSLASSLSLTLSLFLLLSLSLFLCLSVSVSLPQSLSVSDYVRFLSHSSDISRSMSSKYHGVYRLRSAVQILGKLFFPLTVNCHLDINIARDYNIDPYAIYSHLYNTYEHIKVKYVYMYVYTCLYYHVFVYTYIKNTELI